MKKQRETIKTKHLTTRKYMKIHYCFQRNKIIDGGNNRKQQKYKISVFENRLKQFKCEKYFQLNKNLKAMR